MSDNAHIKIIESALKALEEGTMQPFPPISLNNTGKSWWRRTVNAIASAAHAKALDEAAFVCQKLRYATKKEIRERERPSFGPPRSTVMLRAEYDVATKLEKAILALKDKQP